MKRKISFILMLAIILVAVLQVSLFASDSSLYNNNTLRTCTSFVISNDGIASVNVEYNGYSIGIRKAWQECNAHAAKSVLFP